MGGTRRGNRGGVTLIEMLAVIAIIAVLAGILLPTLARVREEGRKTRAMNDINQLIVALQMYAEDHGMYPPDYGEEGDCSNLMRALTEGSYGEWELDGGSLLDPWGRPYVYRNPPVWGQEWGVLFNIFSTGPDGAAGTEDDIRSW